MPLALAATVTQNVTVTVIEPPNQIQDVAYLYRKEFRIDHNIVQAFIDKNFTVTFINERDLPKDFSKYDIIFVGNENFIKKSLIPVNDYRTILVNGYNPRDWGITDRDGVSQLGSTSPLKVITGGQQVQVYTKAFKVKRISIPYYFLDEKNKAKNLTQIATTVPSQSGKKFGDVIAYAQPNTPLFRGKVQKQKLCFFGISESNYWTPAAKNMFNNCINFVAS